MILYQEDNKDLYYTGGIRLICYLVIWGITRGIIIIFRFIMSHIFILTGMLIMAIIATVTTIIVMHNRHKK